LRVGGHRVRVTCPASVRSWSIEMQTFDSIAELRQALAPRREGRRVGLVPTMGALHEGHAALFRAARAECDVVVASLFVNPSQFADPDDLSAYPRHLGRDAG